MTIAIVGAGLIGTSIARAASRADAAARVVMLDRGDALDPLWDADLVVLAAPVDAILDLLHAHGDALRDRVVTDVGSTKRAIVAAAQAAGLTGFVGGHPMAGAAGSGPALARADLFDGRPWFLVPAGANPEAVAAVRGFVASLGARTVVFDDDGSAHDRVMAAVSHLPQLAAVVLMNTIGRAAGHDGLQWAGAGCRDTTRLAGSAASVWESILASNADSVRPLLLAMSDDLRELAGHLTNPSVVRHAFDTANAYRRLIEPPR